MVVSRKLRSKKVLNYYWKENMLEIKTKLKSIRKEKNYTQGFVAEKLGISLRAYTKIENGETQLTIDRLGEIIEILHINPNEIFSSDICDDENETKNIENRPVAEDSISLVQHYEETIVMLKEHIETLKELIKKK